MAESSAAWGPSHAGKMDGLWSSPALSVMLPAMRFYMQPAEQGTTTFINFDHVRIVSVGAAEIEIYFTGSEAPLTIAKNPNTLALISKGMDLSDASKDLVSRM